VPVDRHPTGAPLYLPGCFYEGSSRPTGRSLADAETLAGHRDRAGPRLPLVFTHIGGLYRCGDHRCRRCRPRRPDPADRYAGRTSIVSAERLTEPGVVRSLGAAIAAPAELRNATSTWPPTGIRSRWPDHPRRVRAGFRRPDRRDLRRLPRGPASVRWARSRSCRCMPTRSMQRVSADSRPSASHRVIRCRPRQRGHGSSPKWVRTDDRRDTRAWQDTETPGCGGWSGCARGPGQALRRPATPASTRARSPRMWRISSARRVLGLAGPLLFIGTPPAAAVVAPLPPPRGR